MRHHLWRGLRAPVLLVAARTLFDLSQRLDVASFTRRG
jgi:hypothetical protein